MPDIDDLAKLITEAVGEYTEDVTKAIEKRANKAADTIREEAARDAPRDTGGYAEGFAKSNVSERNGVRRYAIWNKKKPYLGHLLEFGHVKRGGGRVAGKPHMRPAFDKEATAFQDDIRRIIRNGGGS